MTEAKDELRKLAEHAMDIASSIFEKEGKLTLPTWLIATKDEFFIVATPFDDTVRSKDAVAKIIKQKFGENAIRLVFVSETWFRVMKASEGYDGIAPSDHPDRQEAIHVMAEDATGRQLSLRRVIQRGEGTVTLLPAEFTDNAIVGGRFGGLLKRRETMH